MKRLIVLLVRFIGVLFVICGLIFLVSAFLFNGGLLFAAIGLVITVLGFLLLFAKEGYLSDSAPDNGLDKLRKAINANKWEK